MISKSATNYDFENTVTTRSVKGVVTPISTHKVEVGDFQQVSFFPQSKISFWNNEVNFSMRLLGFGVGTHSFDNGKVVWNGVGVNCEFIEEGENFEFKTILLANPATNIISYSLETKDLIFSKQLAITPQELIDDPSIIRPIEMVNGYVAFHSSKTNNNYGSSRAFDFKAPLATDALGVSVYCDQDINIPLKKLDKIIPQSFLDSATYPVTIT